MEVGSNWKIRGSNNGTDLAKAMSSDISFSALGEAVFSWQCPDSRRASVESRRASMERLSQASEETIFNGPMESCPMPAPQVVASVPASQAKDVQKPSAINPSPKKRTSMGGA